MFFSFRFDGDLNHCSYACEIYYTHRSHIYLNITYQQIRATQELHIRLSRNALGIHSTNLLYISMYLLNKYSTIIIIIIIIIISVAL